MYNQASPPSPWRWRAHQTVRQRHRFHLGDSIDGSHLAVYRNSVVALFRVYNLLEAGIVEAESVSIFKQRYRDYCLREPSPDVRSSRTRSRREPHWQVTLLDRRSLFVGPWLFYRFSYHCGYLYCNIAPCFSRCTWCVFACLFCSVFLSFAPWFRGVVRLTTEKQKLDIMCHIGWKY